VTDAAPLDPERIIKVLAKHRVRFVLIGALAARLQGFPRLTADVDITPARDAENLVNLAAALQELDARIFTEAVPQGLPFDCNPQMLARVEMLNLVTSAGRIDVAFVPSGTEGYDDLVQSAVRFEVYGLELKVASLEDIARSKEAAGRSQDLQDVLVIREMLRRKDS